MACPKMIFRILVEKIYDPNQITMLQFWSEAQGQNYDNKHMNKKMWKTCLKYFTSKSDSNLII
jgi:hypothetical protein